MFSRVLSVGLLSLFAAFACAPGSARPSACPEPASAPSDEITELAMGVSRAFGSNTNDSNVQKQQAQSLACSVQGADEVVIVTAG